MADADLHAAILAAMMGSSGQKPVDSGALTRRLADAGHVLLINELLDALDALVLSRAVNTALVSREGEQRAVWWLTGVPPAGINPFRTPIKSHTQADAAAAHAAQVAAEASRVATDPPPQSPHAGMKGEKNKESDMPRIAKPAKAAKSAKSVENRSKAAKPDVIVEDHSRRRAPMGAVMAQALVAVAGLRLDQAQRADELLPRVPDAGSLNSLKTTLRGLVDSKRVARDYRIVDGHNVAYYYDISLAGGLNDGHERNIETLRRLGAEDGQLATDKSVRPGAFDAGPLGGGDIHAPDPVSTAAQALGLEAPGTTRFALWDDGQLLVTAGDDMMVLDAGSTRRLADFLESVMGL